MEVAAAERDWKAHHLRVWKALLGEFRGWSEAEVEAWAKANKLLQGDKSVDDWINHDPIAREIVGEVLPVALREQVTGAKSVELWGDMESALWPSEQFWREPQDADWPLIRAEVARVIAEWETKIAAGYEPEEGEFSGGVIEWVE